ncbi:hypothetical protein [Streptomyces sp. NP160]|uniref:hypothetical protein n=1 Tax=Streptomyces sp. NP160 TaxID=2586637 RepID=UPI001C580160|nr:hypothetical protein [Streptomyces sp. NP160]
MDDRVHQGDALDLVGQVADLLEVGQVTDDDAGATCGEVLQRPRAVVVAGVHDDVVAVLEQRSGRGSPQSMGRAGGQDAGLGGPQLRWAAA